MPHGWPAEARRPKTRGAWRGRRYSPCVNTTEVRDPLGGEPMTVNQYFADNPKMAVGRMERSGTMRSEGELNIKLDKPEELAAILDEAVESAFKSI
jgi:hypothetical protein